MIDPNKICDVEKSKLGSNVIHASNGAIIYYADSEFEANEFIEQWKAFKESFED